MVETSPRNAEMFCIADHADGRGSDVRSFIRVYPRSSAVISIWLCPVVRRACRPPYLAVGSTQPSASADRRIAAHPKESREGRRTKVRTTNEEA